jgi:hypothetical protein
VMQSDEDIGRMVASVPVALGSAMEHFAAKLLEAAAGCVQFSTSRTLSPMHIKYAMMQTPHFSFLEPMLKEIALPKFTSHSEIAALDEQHQLFDYTQQQFQNGNTEHLPLFADTLKPFSSSYAVENAAPMHFSQSLMSPRLMISYPSTFPINDLTAKINLSKFDSSLPTPLTPYNAPLASATEGKRKRGRPKKEQKDRFVSDGFDDIQQQTLTKNFTSQDLPNQMEDQILMPPPKLPIRSVFLQRKSIDDSGSKDDKPF